MIPGLLDRYVLKVVLGSYAAGLLFMTLLFSLIDVLLNLQDYMDAAQASGTSSFDLLLTMARYYGLGLPVVFVTIAPFVSVIAGMFAVSRLMGANEVVPMLFTGRSVRRVLAPVFLTGIASAAGMVLAWEYVIPPLTEPLNAANRRLQGQDAAFEVEGLVVKIRDGAHQTLFVGRYDATAQTMRNVALSDRGSGARDLQQVLARRAHWDPVSRDWRLVDGRLRTPDRSTPREFLGVEDVTPDLLWRLGKEGRETVQLSYSELLDLRALRPLRTDLVIAFHAHITFPLANLVLLLLALPFAVNMERGRRTERVVLSILVCAAYLVFDLTCQQLGKSMLHPVLAAWLPTILFGSIGVAFASGIRT